MRVLMVTPYPPVRDGIASYAVQAVAALRAEGHDVEVLSPGPSAAHHHLDLLGPRGPLALARLVRHYDKVIIQFHPDVFYPVPSSPARHAAVSLALLVAVRACKRCEVVVHEIDYRVGRHGLRGLAARRVWRQVDAVVFHTDAERRDFVAAFAVRPERTVVRPHGTHFVRRTTMTRPAARQSLGIPADERVFLAIGFIQPHKGFDRAVRAFEGLGRHGCSLHVVGSVRVDEPAHGAYLGELRRLVAAVPGAHLHERYVSDELFDRWLVASDVVVLPYRNIWSSGVLERALLYERKVVATAVGGLRHQAGAREEVLLVDDVDLPAALWRAAGVPAEDWPAPGERLYERVQEQVVARALRRRGGPVTGPRLAGARGDGALNLPLRALPPLSLPAPTSSRPGVPLLKRLVARAMAWQVQPLVDHANALRDASVQALERAGPPEQPRAGVTRR